MIAALIKDFCRSGLWLISNSHYLFNVVQLGSWVFLAAGTGMMPGPVDPINIYSQLGSNSSVIIPFKNPTDRQVIVDVVMKERLLSRSGKSSVNCRHVKSGNYGI